MILNNRTPDYAMPLRDTNAASAADPRTVALRALAWTLADERRADRLLALTGLDADELRARAAEPALLAAAIDFLASYEPDLEACAAALGISPADLAAVARGLA